MLVTHPGRPRHLVRVAGIRWSVEECFQAGKGEVGLDQHQVRTWDSWHRYTTLAMFAHAILAVIAARERNNRPNRTRQLIPLTVNEIRHLFAKLITRAPSLRPLAALVRLATPTPAQRPDQPLRRRGDPIDRHLAYITNPAGLLGRSYFCLAERRRIAWLVRGQAD